MAACPADIYEFLLARSEPAELPGRWSAALCDPGWVKLCCSDLLPDLTARFEIDELLAAGVISRDGNGVILRPVLAAGSDYIFVVRTGSATPCTLLPGGRSLGTLPAWQFMLNDRRAPPRIADGQPLLLASDPAALAILSTCGFLVAPAPPISEINLSFLDGLGDALCWTSRNTQIDRRVILVGWDIAKLLSTAPDGFAELHEHVCQLERHFNPNLEFLTWEPSDESVAELQFKLRFGKPGQFATYLLDHFNGEEVYYLDSTHDERPDKTRVDRIGEYLQGRVKGQRRDLQRLQETYVAAVRTQIVEPLYQSAAELEPLAELKHQLVAESVGATVIDVTEAVAEIFIDPGPDKPIRRVKSALSGLERAIQALERLDKPVVHNPFSLRCIG